MNDPAQGQIVFVVISFLSSIAVIASVIIGVIKLNRRIPPLAEDVAKNYATRTELDDEIRDVNVRIDREITMILASNAEQAKKLDSLITTTSHTARAACTRKICRTAQDRPGLQESGAELRERLFQFLSQCRRQACI